MFASAFRPRFAAAATLAVSGAVFALQQQQRPAFTEEAKKKVQVHYFDFTGLAFPIRAALNEAKIPFEDVRHDFMKFGELKPQEDKLPLGQLPVLVMEDGTVACQSNAILRWAGKQSGLYPEDAREALLVDEIMDTTGDFFTKLPRNPDPVENKRLREAFAAGDLAKQMRYLNRKLEQYNGPFLVGDKFTVADLRIVAVVNYISSGTLEHISPELLKEYPNVVKHTKAVHAHPVYTAQMKLENAGK